MIESGFLSTIYENNLHDNSYFMKKKQKMRSSITSKYPEIGLFLLLMIILLFESFDTDKSNERHSDFLMTKAVPVWTKGREKEMNLTLGFRGVFEAPIQSETLLLRIAASTIYRVFFNGEFLGWGPARAAHGYFRVDQYDLSNLMQKGENIVAIEVAGYNVNSYYTIDQPSFLQAYGLLNDSVVLYTGENGHFEAFEIKERLQKVERYSFQRTFTEYYRLQKGHDQWRADINQQIGKVELVQFPRINLLPRHVDLPHFDLLTPKLVHASGTFTRKIPEQYYKDRSLVNISNQFKGYPESELEVVPSQRIQELILVTKENMNSLYDDSSSLELKKNDFSILDFGINKTGFIGAKISCREPTEIWFHFDEMLTEGDVNSKKRIPDVNNQVVYELQPGEYTIETFEPYTLKFLKIMVTKGACKVKNIHLRELASPDHPDATFSCSNEKLNQIYNAAKQTYRQNSLDIFMDCPSRERAGWLCDSYFTAIMEKEFSGYSKVAHNFYENYALPEKFEFLPEGMIPMCYPADHYDGVFIPNWSLWFIIQVDDYAKREGDRQLVLDLKNRIIDLLNYFEKFENEDGLLEKLEGWIFIEWSKANNLVQDVNYPTNMLYSAALESAANLYGNKGWKKKSDHIRSQIQQQSFNGEFFIDNAIREDGILKVTDQITEVCQYYAFFFHIATPDTYPELWKKLITEFGPHRNVTTTYPHVAISNAFIGNYLRMDILSRYGLQSQLISEIEEYFFYMAERTGTLWENVHSQASCNHGFASYIGHVLYRDILGISSIDYQNKEILIRFTDMALNRCNGSIPIEEEVIEFKWEKVGNQIYYQLHAPADYRVVIDNQSTAVIVEQDRQ